MRTYYNMWLGRCTMWLANYFAIYKLIQFINVLVHTLIVIKNFIIKPMRKKKPVSVFARWQNLLAGSLQRQTKHEVHTYITKQVCAYVCACSIPIWIYVCNVTTYVTQLHSYVRKLEIYVRQCTNIHRKYNVQPYHTAITMENNMIRNVNFYEVYSMAIQHIELQLFNRLVERPLPDYVYDSCPRTYVQEEIILNLCSQGEPVMHIDPYHRFFPKTITHQKKLTPYHC